MKLRGNWLLESAKHYQMAKKGGQEEELSTLLAIIDVDWSETGAYCAKILFCLINSD